MEGPTQTVIKWLIPLAWLICKGYPQRHPAEPQLQSGYLSKGVKIIRGLGGNTYKWGRRRAMLVARGWRSIEHFYLPFGKMWPLEADQCLPCSKSLSWDHKLVSSHDSANCNNAEIFNYINSAPSSSPEVLLCCQLWQREIEAAWGLRQMNPHPSSTSKAESEEIKWNKNQWQLKVVIFI